jgi:RecJ-like exonuclease
LDNIDELGLAGPVLECTRCRGSGTLMWHELDDYTGMAPDLYDCVANDTQYPCPDCHGRGTLQLTDVRKLCDDNRFIPHEIVL